MKRFFLILLTAVMLLCLCSGCGEEEIAMETPTMVTPSPTPETTPEPTPEATPTPTPEPTPTPTPEPETVNPLSGEPCTAEVAVARPIAVMINNHHEAQPQSSISHADIIYEMPVEGWMTRMIAIFQDPSQVEIFGPVRSARPNFVTMVEAYDAIYYHAGGSTDGVNLIYELGLDHVDATQYDGVYFYRDGWRAENRGLEHSLMMNQDQLQASIQRFEFRTEHEADYENNMIFTEDGTPAGGASAGEFTVWYSEYGKYTTFIYDEEAGAYRIEQYGDAYVDGDNDEEVLVENVVILITTIYPYDDAAHQYVDLESGGDALFFCGGKYIEAHWTREAGDRQIVYTDASGEQIPFGVGHTFVAVISDETSVYEIG